MKIIALCAGYAGLDMAVQAVLGGELAAVADIDPGACMVLAHRFPDVPNLGDIETIDWERGDDGKPYAADILTAGFPLDRARTYRVQEAGRGCGPAPAPASGPT